MCQKNLINDDINLFDWDKLNIAAENIESNLYVGDLPKIEFEEILYKFRKLFFEYNPENKHNNIGFVNIMDILKLINKKILLNNQKFVRYQSEIDPSNPFQSTSENFKKCKDEDGEYFLLEKNNKFHLKGLFNKITIYYKLSGSVKKKGGVLIINSKKFPLYSTYGKIKKTILSFNKDNWEILKESISIKIKKNNKLCLYKLKIDYPNNLNYIKAGYNEYDQIISGNYKTEKWSNGDVFWTNGFLRALLFPKGNEKNLSINFQSGYKQKKMKNII